MGWHAVFATQGPLALGAVLRFAVAYLNARTKRMSEPQTEGELDVP